MTKRILIIAGPNGAGKTTFAREFLPNEAALTTFVNADLIAAGLSPFNPAAAAVRAGRLMLAEIDHHVRRGESFAFETTLSGRGYLRRIGEWRRLGYRVELVFLGLPSPEAALERVAKRVAQGGHNVPQEVVLRRFHNGRQNFEKNYRAIVDSWVEYDGSGNVPMLVTAYERGQ
ncbi:MAG: AAA family ATPase [Planctomycetota bacterium]|nr:AAA family ATPase [Planctomycetaceae bacterium]MDQ3331559.1 AAA family ATPase [Planctomycetota bacterium]